MRENAVVNMSDVLLDECIRTIHCSLGGNKMSNKIDRSEECVATHKKYVKE